MKMVKRMEMIKKVKQNLKKEFFPQFTTCMEQVKDSLELMNEELQETIDKLEEIQEKIEEIECIKEDI